MAFKENATSYKTTGGATQPGVAVTNPGDPADFAAGVNAPAPYLTSGMDGSGYIGVSQEYRQYGVPTSQPLPTGHAVEVKAPDELDSPLDDETEEGKDTGIAPAHRSTQPKKPAVKAAAKAAASTEK